ncbi:MAG: DUF1214 domain-containing protein [Acidimicrobiia bacterium]
MVDPFLPMAGGVNKWFHFRAPTAVDVQPVIRMNRDTLYSANLTDISAGASVTLPEAGGWYMTLMVVDAEHYINDVFSEPGTYELTVEKHGSPHVALALRTFVDPNDPEDVAAVNALQDSVVVESNSATPYTHPDYDEESLNATRDALLRLGEGLRNSDRTFGKESDVDPTRHLIGTAMGWGGLPESEAYYYLETEPQAAGRYTFTLEDVPVDAFWSVTIYNRAGYLEPNPYDSYGLNSVTSVADSNGIVTLNLAPDEDGLDNYLYVMDGWNYALRLYKPRQAVLDKTWTPPIPIPVG